MNVETRTRRSLLGPLALAILLALAAAGCDRLPGRGGGDADATATAEAKATPKPRPTADRSVASVVTADGHLAFVTPPQALSFKVGGTLAELPVTEGQVVGEGDLVARVDTLPLDLTLQDARAALAGSRSTLTQLETGADLERARLEIERAKNGLWGAQANRDSTCGMVDLGLAKPASCDSAQASVQSAEQGVQLAEQALLVTQASRDDDLAAARARLESARLALQRAQSDRGKAELTAPYTGTISTVHVMDGAPVGPGAPVVTLTRTRPLRFETTNLGERNVADVEAGAPVEITLTAFPERTLGGTVERVAAGSGTAPGLNGASPTFTVYIAVDDEGLPLRAGMTGRVGITVAVEEVAEPPAEATVAARRPGCCGPRIHYH